MASGKETGSVSDFCTNCGRRIWDGGSALRDDRCSAGQVGGFGSEACTLHKILRKAFRGLMEIRAAEEAYRAGSTTNGDFAGAVNNSLRRALDEGIPFGSTIVQSWNGGEDSEYARVVEDRDRLLRERDAAASALRERLPEMGLKINRFTQPGFKLALMGLLNGNDVPFEYLVNTVYAVYDDGGEFALKHTIKGGTISYTNAAPREGVVTHLRILFKDGTSETVAINAANFRGINLLSFS